VAPPACPAGGELFERTELYFGLRRRDGRAVESTTFEVFVEEFVVPQFETGFTLVETDGRYASGGRKLREPSRMLIVLHHGDAGTDHALEHIRARYKELFAQDSVLRVDLRACARF
jgi:hypothetical protein